MDEPHNRTDTENATIHQNLLVQKMTMVDFSILFFRIIENQNSPFAPVTIVLREILNAMDGAFHAKFTEHLSNGLILRNYITKLIKRVKKMWFEDCILYKPTSVWVSTRFSLFISSSCSFRD